MKFKEKEYDEKYERLLNLLEKENLLLRDEIRREDEVINILLDNFSNCLPEHSNYITSKNTDASTQTDHQTKNNTQISTAGNNHRTLIASEKKQHKKLNISPLNNSTCDKTHVNNSNNNKERENLDQDDKKSESEVITGQINPNSPHKKRFCTIIVEDSTVKHLHGNSIANKTNSYNIIFVQPFPGVCTEAIMSAQT